ncbi:MucB/RseB C-terminal domain-containing protein [Pseudorhodoferax sp.]|uniref:MucB/RseB C-terminal domain-containing protein n=1 Tax=Pseudorhodoferax sp. TaxID=1993553 RepID=UPI002DD6B6D8|nr:MucB/RseB C-terminal domain-containing protein [Pseudorhodoferax sp.]
MLSSGRAALAALSLSLAACTAFAQASFGPADSVPPAAEQRSIGEWLMRMHDASRKRAYTGTFVVSSDAMLASARIWHACEGEQQIERVDALTGPPRTTFRRNDHVVTFLQDSKVARLEKREALGLFPNLLQAADSSIAEFYSARQIGRDRVAGFEADIVLLKPKDQLRFGYRVWSEKKSGLVIKLQTLGLDGRVLEQAAFSELQIDAPVRLDSLVKMMNKTTGYRTERLETQPVDPAAEGWALRELVPGFRSMSCIKRAPQAGMAPSTMQWVFSDGLASVSLFVEPYDAQRHLKEGLVAMGATQSLMQRTDDWWLTAVGEVPTATLKTFAKSLQRTRK